MSKLSMEGVRAKEEMRRCWDDFSNDMALLGDMDHRENEEKDFASALDEIEASARGVLSDDSHGHDIQHACVEVLEVLGYVRSEAGL